METSIPKVYKWGSDLFREQDIVDTDSIYSVIEWCNHFSGPQRLPTDVSRALERCVVGSYQIGYLWDYPKCKDYHRQIEYFEEGIASVMIHIIASYEMTGRESCLQFAGFGSWKHLVEISKKVLEEHPETFDSTMLDMSSSTFKYQRWMMYYHMNRTKRWNEEEFKKCFGGILVSCTNLAAIQNCDLGNGFALAMSKIQDGEIRRH